MHAVVVGAGLAGSACAQALAGRGWTVQILDSATHAARGTSSVPVGLFGPLESVDDNLTSQLIRAGLQHLLAQGNRHLRAGRDWSAPGILSLKPGSAPKLLQPAGWLRPAQLVEAWLKQPGVAFTGGRTVDRLRLHRDGWQMIDVTGTSFAQASLVILAAAHACRGIVERSIEAAPELASQLALPPLNDALAGQISWGLMNDAIRGCSPALPVNGQGHMVADVPSDAGPFWAMGAGFEPPEALAEPQALHTSNLARLRSLLPTAADALAGNRSTWQHWQGVRCVGRTRLPQVRQLSRSKDADHPQLWLCNALGSRGITWAALCGEVLAAAICGEALPLSAPLERQILDIQRRQGLRG
jgi:tRNA 5-methylaminomethyl-2-thiouridine biosynthesis bifunctional protein